MRKQISTCICTYIYTEREKVCVYNIYTERESVCVYNIYIYIYRERECVCICFDR